MSLKLAMRTLIPACGEEPAEQILTVDPRDRRVAGFLELHFDESDANASVIFVICLDRSASHIAVGFE